MAAVVEIINGGNPPFLGGPGMGDPGFAAAGMGAPCALHLAYASCVLSWAARACHIPSQARAYYICAAPCSVSAYTSTSCTVTALQCACVFNPDA